MKLFRLAKKNISYAIQKTKKLVTYIIYKFINLFKVTYRIARHYCFKPVNYLMRPLKKIIRATLQKHGYQVVKTHVIKQAEEDLLVLGPDRAFCKTIMSITHENLDCTAKVYADTAHTLLHSGYPDEAAKFYELSLQTKMDKNVYSLYLQTLLFTDPKKIDPEMTYQANVRWNKSFAPVNSDEFDDSYTFEKNRKLRIGYTCHFVDDPTSTTLLLPMLEGHDKIQCETFFYSDQDPKITSERARKSVDHWRDTSELSDDDFTHLVRKDQLDVFFELNGHCLANRYSSIVHRVAPIQISFYNISDTCGVKNMDFILIPGEVMDMDALQEYYSEAIIYTSQVFPMKFDPVLFPAPAEQPPCITNNYVTFGSFGNIHKVSRQQIKLWARILHAVPNARLIFKASAFNQKYFVDAYKQHFMDFGIELERIEFQSHSPYRELLQQYDKIDIALDTFPHTAGTTTVNALYQGVPVITSVGTRQASKHGLLSYSVIGHEELLCYSEDEYVEKAVRLANDFDRIAFYKKILRQKLSNSSKADVVGFMEEITSLVLNLHNRYTERTNIS